MKLIILDRDGVINQDSDSFVKNPDEWIALPGSLHAIARLTQAGWKVVVATNQSGLARGLFDMDTLTAIHTKMRRELAAAGGSIDAVFMCPHGPDDNCACRKPKPGMFEQIGHRYDVDLAGVPAVGDSLRDLQASSSVGCSPWLVLSGNGKKTLAKGGLPDNTRVCDDLSAVVDALLQDH
ncbi:MULTISPECIES: D-glycero-beta-D-manno-heptose 1,7-bisphosphate 7-phosphatase [Achromobacter]|uniref:D,D-heptose 1,7-bisphosphate phosphatase n=1 Tax=Alcaligenes xylosoxydans xylosoxydans TaxID=85698 RepID=A0A424WFJ5_ALCXX|nr:MULTISPECIES: D-glycero-beta-D-manno-heptose 1,7-bisphosphate 7-phosphatase [Achromobacter]MBC9905879.1 D-glycero-beta-D-manno-heptose 1,7-bisphosphate 7-phosphatase [Achromobacter xylosoxidans]MBD0869518.1 D-glycero-beta-D-manno-heptose 1,7-bisphosphate 7-phosphatase [Achromobacter xylosoxidans]MDH1301245.1 D-glycero-beta-D-manno-heptose 1,7-bisphosphate 7-phosphatase [Achromobacter sp. GD03932]QNP85082.1 D-glycero-beta-D-manno-heptose 1,7-bisphosphate 7-phosphatase [Achromobacter xylosoxid